MLMKNSGLLAVMVIMLLSLTPSLVKAAANPAEVKKVVDAVTRAEALVAKEGEAAFAKLQAPDGGFVDGDLYVFVFSLKDADKGVLLSHVKEGMVGKGLLTLKEPETGRYFAQEFVTIAEGPGKGWTEYKWAKPNAKEIAVKATYIMKVTGKDMAVGSGIYDVTKAEAEQIAK